MKQQTERRPGREPAAYSPIPARPIPNVYYSQEIYPQVKACISRFPGAVPAEIRPSALTYAAVASHADLYCCALGDRILTGVPAGPDYPLNTGFCGVQLGEFFVHNLRFTAPEVRSEVKRLGLTEINVRQGYTKCGLVVVNGGRKPAVITSDRGLEKALAPYPIDVLTVSTGHVLLPGFPYGFLGGASGLLGHTVLFHGDLSAHPDFHRICAFIRARDRTPLWFPGLPLSDIGSIITLL
ncbi:DUF6873 family GME fold protein [Bacilliculturomica massiliensis]|uniref:DUF6873 family GME fold protein n=1 Tax=Bacilliculturomica massiliensis TaxID=1917867 RepID=UPI001030F86F|nr:hypothetical protein [Bacilliculturomica massiliensis]